MALAPFIDYFVHHDRFLDQEELRKTRLFVRACLLTSIFSASYIGFSILFEFHLGVYLMIYNALGFIVLAFFGKTKTPIGILGNIYSFLGASAIIALTYFSGGIWSALYPWIIAIPVLSLLVVGRSSAIFWGAISFLVMIWFGILAEQGVELPVQYNQEYKTLWFLSVVPGLLLIILFISFVFEHTQTKALKDLQDINTQLQNQKDTIASQSERLAKILEEKDYIIRILAHDLRSPLNNISSLVSLMSIDNEKERITEYNQMIYKASENAKHLVDRVLEMDASGQDKVKLNLEEIDVVTYLEGVVESIGDTARAKNIELTFENNTSGVKVLADDTYFGLIFENLLSNAIKFSEKGKNVIVSTSCSETVLQVRIIDEGPGVPINERDKLFQKFSKLSARPTAGESSTGLGLSLVKRYTELIDGTIYYEDVEGKGAVFVVELPIAG